MSTIVLIDGQPFLPEVATISVFDRGLLYGDSVFETIGTYRGRPFALAEHVSRLRRSADLVFIALPLTDQQIAEEVRRGVELAQNVESYIRLIVTRGSGDLGLDPALAVAPKRIVIVSPLDRPTKATYETGVRAITAQTQRATDASDAVGAKVGNYLAAVLAMKKAHAVQANEALIVDRNGAVIEGATSNLFWVACGHLFTPPLSVGILDGITRRVVLEAAEELNLEVQFPCPSVAQLLAADEIFITSSIRQMLSVVELDGHTIGPGQPGPIYRRLFERFVEIVERRTLSPS